MTTSNITVLSIILGFIASMAATAIWKNSIGVGRGLLIGVAVFFSAFTIWNNFFHPVDTW